MEDSLKHIDFSKMHRYSRGIVVEDNRNNDFEIKIYPIEKGFTFGGELSKIKTFTPTITSKVLDIIPDAIIAKFKDSKEKIVIDETNYILATWLIDDTNRITPPNVCKGEEVIIYRYSNRDEYYWITEKTDLKLRKSEHVVYTYCDKDNLDETEDEIEDRYSIIFSPRDKYIRLHTTDKYGEYTTYDIELNTKDGMFTLLDGKKNSINLDSSTDTFTIHIEGKKAKYDLIVNGDDGLVEILDDKKNSINLDTVKSKLTVNINNNIEYNTKNFTVNCDNFKVKTSVFDISTNSYNLSSTNNTIKSSLTTFTGGNIIHDGIHIDKTSVHIGNLGFTTSTPVG